MFKAKYSGVTWYCHNFGKYDIYFRLKTLINYNYKNDNEYKLKFVFRDNIVLKVKITRIKNKRSESVALLLSATVILYLLIVCII